MQKELKLQDRLKLAKHFNAGFELQPDQVDWVDGALSQLHAKRIKQTAADVAYKQLMEKQQKKQVQQYLIVFSIFNVAVMASALGINYWLM